MANKSSDDNSPFDSETSEKEIDRDRGEAVATEEDHEETETDEDHDVDILEHWNVNFNIIFITKNTY